MKKKHGPRQQWGWVEIIAMVTDVRVALTNIAVGVGGGAAAVTDQKRH